jgi:hypothetical protein
VVADLVRSVLDHLFGCHAEPGLGHLGEAALLFPISLRKIRSLK